VAAASPSSRPPSSGAAFLLAKADGDSYTESLKSGGITFLVLLEAAPARAAAYTGFRSSNISIGYIAYTAQ
jgi:hypothetical protein